MSGDSKMEKPRSRNGKRKEIKTKIIRESPVKIVGIKSEDNPFTEESLKKVKRHLIPVDKPTVTPASKPKCSKEIKELVKEYATTEKDRFDEKLETLIREKKNKCNAKLNTIRERTPKLIAIQKEKEKILREAFAGTYNAKDNPPTEVKVADVPDLTESEEKMYNVKVTNVRSTRATAHLMKSLYQLPAEKEIQIAEKEKKVTLEKLHKTLDDKIKEQYKKTLKSIEKFKPKKGKEENKDDQCKMLEIEEIKPVVTKKKSVTREINISLDMSINVNNKKEKSEAREPQVRCKTPAVFPFTDPFSDEQEPRVKEFQEKHLPLFQEIDVVTSELEVFRVYHLPEILALDGRMKELEQNFEEEIEQQRIILLTPSSENILETTEVVPGKDEKLEEENKPLSVTLKNSEPTLITVEDSSCPEEKLDQNNQNNKESEVPVDMKKVSIKEVRSKGLVPRDKNSQLEKVDTGSNGKSINNIKDSKSCVKPMINKKNETQNGTMLNTVKAILENVNSNFKAGKPKENTENELQINSLSKTAKSVLDEVQSVENMLGKLIVEVDKKKEEVSSNEIDNLVKALEKDIIKTDTVQKKKSKNVNNRTQPEKKSDSKGPLFSERVEIPIPVLDDDDLEENDDGDEEVIEERNSEPEHGVEAQNELGGYLQQDAEPGPSGKSHCCRSPLSISIDPPVDTKLQCQEKLLQAQKALESDIERSMRLIQILEDQKKSVLNLIANPEKTESGNSKLSEDIKVSSHSGTNSSLATSDSRSESEDMLKDQNSRIRRVSKIRYVRHYNVVWFFSTGYEEYQAFYRECIIPFEQRYEIYRANVMNPTETYLAKVLKVSESVSNFKDGLVSHRPDKICQIKSLIKKTAAIEQELMKLTQCDTEDDTTSVTSKRPTTLTYTPSNISTYSGSSIVSNDCKKGRNRPIASLITDAVSRELKQYEHLLESTFNAMRKKTPGQKLEVISTASTSQETVSNLSHCWYMKLDNATKDSSSDVFEDCVSEEEFLSVNSPRSLPSPRSTHEQNETSNSLSTPKSPPPLIVEPQHNLSVSIPKTKYCFDFYKPPVESVQVNKLVKEEKIQKSERKNIQNTPKVNEIYVDNKSKTEGKKATQKTQFTANNIFDCRKTNCEVLEDILKSCMSEMEPLRKKANETEGKKKLSRSRNVEEDSTKKSKKDRSRSGVLKRRKERKSRPRESSESSGASWTNLKEDKSKKVRQKKKVDPDVQDVMSMYNMLDKLLESQQESSTSMYRAFIENTLYGRYPKL